MKQIIILIFQMHLLITKTNWLSKNRKKFQRVIKCIYVIYEAWICGRAGSKKTSTKMKPAMQPRICFMSLASKLKMSWVKIKMVAMGQSDFHWLIAFGHKARETKAWNGRNIPLVWCLWRLFNTDCSVPSATRLYHSPLILNLSIILVSKTKWLNIAHKINKSSDENNWYRHY